MKIQTKWTILFAVVVMTLCSVFLFSRHQQREQQQQWEQIDREVTSTLFLFHDVTKQYQKQVHSFLQHNEKKNAFVLPQSVLDGEVPDFLIDLQQQLKGIGQRLVSFSSLSDYNAPVYEEAKTVLVALDYLEQDIIDEVIQQRNRELKVLEEGMTAFQERSFFFSLLFAAASLAIVVGMISLFFSFFRPYRFLSNQLKMVQSDTIDLNKRILISRKDEWGTIALLVNELMDRILELMKKVQRAGIQVTASATSISSSTKQLDTTVKDFSHSAHEVLETSQEISKTSTELVSTMSDVSTVADETAELANTGQQELSQLESTIVHMEEAFQGISSKLEVISQKAANITTVITTITKIADQTNLLSLNASIEAEKAGEFGRGFAVIARETRRLADQTAVATLDIEKMISEMKSAVMTGVMGIENFSKQLNSYVTEVRTIASQLTQIINGVQTLTPRFGNVHSGMQSQAMRAQAISQSMLGLNESAEKTSQSLQEATFAMEQLYTAARNMHKEVTLFKMEPIAKAPANAN